MMTFLSLNQKDLNRLLNICNQISQKRGDAEIFSYLKISVDKEKVEFSSINPNAFFKTQLTPSNLDLKEDSLEFLIKTETLSSAVSSFNDEIVAFEVDLEKLVLIVKSSHSKHRLRINLELLQDFIYPKKEEEKSLASIKIKAVDFVEACKASLISVGNPKSVYDPKFLSICLTLDSPNKSIFVVSTDRYRITKTSLEMEILNMDDDIKDQKQNFLLPPKNLQFLISSLDKEEDFTIEFGENFLWTKYGENELILKYNQGDYPDYEKIIPQNFACQFEISIKDLLQSLKQVYLCAKTNTVNKSITIKLEPKNNKLSLSAQTEIGEMSESEVTIENYEGTQEDWTQAFNADYLINYLSILVEEKIFWEANPGKPSILSPFQKKDKQIYLVSGLK